MIMITKAIQMMIMMISKIDIQRKPRVAKLDRIDEQTKIAK